jgi:carbonic anhydrase
MAIQHPDNCSCCSDMLRGAFSRRGLMLGAAAGVAAAILSPYAALAASGNYEAMVLSCIDPRFQKPVANYMARRRLTGKYSAFVIAGASIGVVAPAFKDWQKAFWDNLAATIDLHNIKSIIAINHRTCGAAKIAYGDAAVANNDAETKTHRDALAEFRKQVGEKQPKLKIETHLMALGGKVETFT